MDISGLDEGDLAMLIYRTADSLRQLEGLTQSHPHLAASATEASNACYENRYRFPTDTESQSKIVPELAWRIEHREIQQAEIRGQDKFIRKLEN